MDRLVLVELQGEVAEELSLSTATAQIDPLLTAIKGQEMKRRGSFSKPRPELVDYHLHYCRESVLPVNQTKLIPRAVTVIYQDGLLIIHLLYHHEHHTKA